MLYSYWNQFLVILLACWTPALNQINLTSAPLCVAYPYYRAFWYAFILEFAKTVILWKLNIGFDGNLSGNYRNVFLIKRLNPSDYMIEGNYNLPIRFYFISLHELVLPFAFWLNFVQGGGCSSDGSALAHRCADIVIILHLSNDILS